MKRILQSVLFVMLLLGGMSACTEELDFNQFDDLEATPTYEAGILYLEAQEDLINLISGTNVFSQNFNFDAFSSDIFADRVLDGTITFVVENTTSKELAITVELLDEADTVTDTEIFSIEPAPTAIIQREIAYGDSGRSIDIIKTLSTIRVTATNLGDNTSVSTLPDPLITLKSSGKFRLRVK
ncbi:hypothetical protein FEE95_01550 [Maribacter algarum]|uniref:DUF4843 domain-containing protein n=1 Tax=Maribacter algarum (ex Zhang et al. 2020) TaxID=2578118 RepID=A0A5S3PT25_9FLAO|nr:hypothetical protein [Maribacter algarum]TMM58141.1 hypothetical protein FEE95_01550 [Maribacter algarum]